MRYSGSAIFLLVLLGIRIISQPIILLFGTSSLETVYLLLSSLVIGLVYIIAFVGMIKKTRWALVMVMFIALIDLLFAIAFSVTISEFLSIGIVDIVLLVLSVNILTRIRQG